jgi:hypothetical protein
MNTVSTVHDKSKDELLDILEDKKKKASKDNKKKYAKNKVKRHEEYIKKKKQIDCDCGKKVLNTSLSKHKLSKQHLHDVREKARKQEVLVINMGAAADKVENSGEHHDVYNCNLPNVPCGCIQDVLDPNYTEVSPSS